jgi:hypothetical protein
MVIDFLYVISKKINISQALLVEQSEIVWDLVDKTLSIFPYVC